MADERVVPAEQDSSILFDEHAARYRFAAQFVKEGSHGLDIACGTGYGTAMLAGKGAGSFCGVDISSEAIGYANAHYKSPAVSFILSDALKTDLGRGQFDIIVSFETIEHLSREQGPAFLKKLYDMLKEEGLLIISCPNRDTYPPSYNKNLYHLHEYSFEEITTLIAQFFPEARVHCQEMRYFRRLYKKTANLFHYMPQWLIRLMVKRARGRYERGGLKGMGIFSRILLYECSFGYDVFEFVEEYRSFKPVFAVFVCRKGRSAH